MIDLPFNPDDLGYDTMLSRYLRADPGRLPVLMNICDRLDDDGRVGDRARYYIIRMPLSHRFIPSPGFAALPSNVYAWIVQRHPEKLPASIMALAPNDPQGALERYFIGLRRGYLVN